MPNNSFTFDANQNLNVTLSGTAAGSVTVVGTEVTYTDKSGTVASGGVSQTLAAANASRRGFWIQNQSSDNLWLSSNGAAVATQPSLQIPSGALYEFPSTGIPVTALAIFGATTGQAFAAKEW